MTFHDFSWLHEKPMAFQTLPKRFYTVLVMTELMPGGSASSTGSSFGAWNGRALTRWKWRRKSPDILRSYSNEIALRMYCAYIWALSLFLRQRPNKWSEHLFLHLLSIYIICYLALLSNLAHCWNSWNLNEHRMPTPQSAPRGIAAAALAAIAVVRHDLPWLALLMWPIVTVQLVAHLFEKIRIG